MGKRLLLIGGNFFPELTGIGKYNGEMIDRLASQGYHCTVVTSFPYYPHWKVQEPYARSSAWFKSEMKITPGNGSGSIEIFRCPHYIPKKPTGLKRILSDFSFCLAAFIKIFQLLFAKKHDFVLVVAPPFQLGLLGILYKKIILRWRQFVSVRELLKTIIIKKRDVTGTKEKERKEDDDACEEKKVLVQYIIIRIYFNNII